MYVYVYFIYQKLQIYAKIRIRSFDVTTVPTTVWQLYSFKLPTTYISSVKRVKLIWHLERFITSRHLSSGPMERIESSSAWNYLNKLTTQQPWFLIHLRAWTLNEGWMQGNEPWNIVWRNRYSSARKLYIKRGKSNEELLWNGRA